MEWLDKLAAFYFGIGGFGDLLFLLSTFYDRNPESSIIFWANNKSFIEEAVTLFPSLNKKIVFQGWPHDFKKQFDEIVAHRNFKGKAHIPDDLKYVEEWEKKPEKYRKNVHIPFKFLQQKFSSPFKKLDVGVAFQGSQTEFWKRKHLNEEEFHFALKYLRAIRDPFNYAIYVFGSLRDKIEFPLNAEEENDNCVDYRDKSLEEQMKKLGECSELYSTDTWHKTFMMLIGKPSIVIKNRYEKGNQDLKLRFNSNVDPGDRIFLHNWPKMKLINFEDFNKC